MAQFVTNVPALNTGMTNQIAKAVEAGVRQASRTEAALTMNSGDKRQKQYQASIQKEAALARALTTEAGLKKIAANMANPVRFYLDYKGIFRKFAVVEQMKGRLIT